MPPLPPLPELDNDEVNNLFDSFGDDNLGNYDPEIEEPIHKGYDELLAGYEDSLAGRDSDDEGQEAQLFLNHAEHDEDGMEDEEEAVTTVEQIEPATSLLGAPPGWMQPMLPITFDCKPEFNAPATWEEVDNPGSWSKYACYRQGANPQQAANCR
jgi:hypothetical protein